MVQIRKTQKTKTGLLINIPAKIAEELNLKGNENLKIKLEGNKITMEVIKL